MRRSATILVVFLFAGMATAGEEENTAAPITERGRSLSRIVDGILLPRTDERESERTLILLLDPTASLSGAGFAEEIEAGLARHADALSRTRISVVRFGGKASSPTRDAGEVARAAAAALESPGKAIQNVYEEVRRVAGGLGAEPGIREIALVTLENGDAEDDVERTVAALTRAGVRLSVVAREAFLSDTYWVNRSVPAPPRGVTMAGGEAAFVEVPWGWLFQQSMANQTVSSGFAMYGLSRMAAATGGTVYLFFPPSAGHQCAVYGSCPFCSGDHAPTGRAYQTHRLRALAPSTLSRAEAMRDAARDPYLAAVLRTWERASKDGLLYSRPSVKRAGGGLKVERRQTGSLAPLTSLAFSSNASRADELARTAGELAAELESAIAKGDEAGGLRRYRSVADLTRIMLEITRVNLLGYAAFCRDTGPALLGDQRRNPEPPEVPSINPEMDYIGVGYTNLVFCHGVRCYERVRLPGGEAMVAEIRALADKVEGFLARESNSPFAAAVYRSGLARFHFTIRGKYVAPDRRVPGSDSESTATSPDRPSRDGGGTGGGSGGPASGGD